MRINLEKPFLLRLYCYTHQAYRSVAFALGADWSEFLVYYHGERIEELKRLTNDAHRLIERLGLPSARLPRAQVAQTMPPRGIVQHFLGAVFASWKSQWPFSGEELAFMVTTLDALVRFLESVVRPEEDALLSLRADLCFCESIIQERCQGLPELHRARGLEHFWQAAWMTPVRMVDILGKDASGGKLARKSA